LEDLKLQPSYLIPLMLVENLFKQLDGLMEAIKKHLNVRFEIKGIEREDIWIILLKL